MSTPTRLIKKKRLLAGVIAGSDFYDWTFLAGDIFPVSSCLRRGRKKEQEEEKRSSPSRVGDFRIISDLLKHAGEDLKT